MALDELLALLMPHTGAEESGLFAELRAEGSLAEAVDQLCAGHDDIHGVLSAASRSAPNWAAVLAALDRLRRHIDNEEHGLFPAAVIALPIEAWDRVTPICRIARPSVAAVNAATGGLAELVRTPAVG
jgi:hypothetical protein